MTTYTLMSAQSVPNNAPGGVPPVPVPVLIAATRARFILSVSGSVRPYALVTILAAPPGFTYPNQQVAYDPILVMVVGPGSVGRMSTEDLGLGATYYSYAAILNGISNGARATVTMEV